MIIQDGKRGNNFYDHMRVIINALQYQRRKLMANIKDSEKRKKRAN